MLSKALTASNCTLTVGQPYGIQSNCVSGWNYNAVMYYPNQQPTIIMSDTEKKPKLSADEKLIVQALKGEKSQSEISMLIVVSRLTGRTPAAVMEVLDDVAGLVKDKLGGELPASTTA